jgi:hypothetical protein
LRIQLTYPSFLDCNTLLVLALERIAEETEGEVESGLKHTVLRLSAEDGDGVGLGEILVDESRLIEDLSGGFRIINRP